MHAHTHKSTSGAWQDRSKKTVHVKCIKDATYEEEIHKIQPITVLFVKD